MSVILLAVIVEHEVVGSRRWLGRDLGRVNGSFAIDLPALV